jgi:hypothetical protein
VSTYFVANAAAPTAAAPAKQALAAATTRTLLQVAPSSGNPIVLLEWGISFDGSAAAQPVQVELFSSTAAQTSLTAHTATSVTPYLRSADVGASSVTLGTAATGFTSTVAEVTPTGVRQGDLQLVAPTNQYVKMWPLGREFFVAGGAFLRIRATSPTAVNTYCYAVFADM